jgi:endonuclease/exonuclease/phosphatase family metal-dependent hydrolase
MPYYPRLRNRNGDSDLVRASKLRGCQKLVTLKRALDALPERKLDGSLLLATWNLREFGAQKMGPRLIESLFYIAEIINRFDLVALQEVRRDLEEFKILRDILGKWWKALFTGVTEGTQGNSERSAFLYDSRKIDFGGLTGQVVLPPVRQDGKYVPVMPIARTPFIVGFQAGWFKFTICTTHLFYGQPKGDDEQRLRETDLLAEALATEAGRKEAWARNMILLGDLNLFSVEDKQFGLLKKHGFRIPKATYDTPTNIGGSRPYDQIAFIAPSIDDKLDEAASGIFPFFKHVFGDGEDDVYAPHLKRSGSGKPYDYMQWRTFQMSDHYPLWVELRTDFSAKYIGNLISENQSNAGGSGTTRPGVITENRPAKAPASTRTRTTLRGRSPRRSIRMAKKGV